MNLGLLSNHKLKKFPWYNEQNEQNACHSYLAMGGIGNEMECFVRDHPFKTSAFGEGSKICRRIVVKNCRRLKGVGVKNREKFADVLNGWSLTEKTKRFLIPYKMKAKKHHLTF